VAPCWLEVARYVVAAVDELPEGGRVIVEVAGRSIGVFRSGGRYYALRNRCPHQGGPLCKGHLLGSLSSNGPGDFDYDPDRRLLECPWHGWEFDLETGQSWFDPARTRVKAYPVEVARLDGRAKGPYVAETFPVTVERDYVVVEVSG
jgi:nitrite reductase/ring-hydroxylating ferredoxin subunit